MSWSGVGRNTLSHTGAKFRRQSTAGLWPGAKVRNVLDDSVACGESCAPRGHTVLQMCRWANTLHAELVKISYVAHVYSQ